MRKSLFLFLVTFSYVWCPAQTDDPVLARINYKSITRSEFEYIYNNRLFINESDSQTPHEYLQLLINYKLKVAAAEAAGLDTGFVFREEVANYRRQLAKTFLSRNNLQETSARHSYEKMRESSTVRQIRITCIFKKLPQNATPRQLQEVTCFADSIYKVLHATGKEADFELYANQFSDYKEELRLNRLHVSGIFEKEVFSLKKNEISKPFLTPHGLFIVKVLDEKSMPSFEEVREETIRRINRQRSGIDMVRESARRIKNEYNYLPEKEGIEELLRTGKTDKPLFRLNGNIYTGLDLEVFAQSYSRRVTDLFDAFLVKTAFDYENSRLETIYPEFKFSMQEFRDGMLLHEITKQEVEERRIQKDETVKAGKTKKAKKVKKKTQRKNSWSAGSNDSPKQLLADYQKYAETLWMARLQATFMVEINEEVLKTVNNHRSNQNITLSSPDKTRQQCE